MLRSPARDCGIWTGLSGVAQKCYDEEVALRDLSPQQVEASAPPEWLGESACACTFASFPGSFSASDAANAREVLEAAGIPCHISVDEIEYEPAVDDSPVRYEYRLMVPGALNLHATSVLDREIFNPEVEAEWAAHFQALSDEELHALSAEVICAGLEDRIMRLIGVALRVLMRQKSIAVNLAGVSVRFPMSRRANEGAL
jgi:hypothetical protein